MRPSSPLQSGLTSSEAQKLLLKFGPNEIAAKKDFSILKLIIAQFSSFLIIILLISGTISIVLGETIDGIAIFAVLLINAAIGFFQEYKAENAVKALKKLVVATTTVLRDNQQQKIPITSIVPGDIVMLSEGDKIPADLEILESFSLKVDESILTGESLSQAKQSFAPTNKAPQSGDPHHKSNLLFKGTIITTGHAKARVLSTGANTEFGKIVDLLSKEEKTRSPLDVQLDNLGKKIGLVVLVLIALLFIFGTLRGISILEMLMTSVSLGVSAIPEGMPIIVTLTLAMGVQALSRKKAIVRKMNAIETLGATTIICSDKTGTLTLNEMTVKKIYTNFEERKIPGLGYGWREKITLNSREEKKLMEICENCNNAFVDKNIIGDPTEIALKVLVRKARYVKTYRELDEKTFTSERKMMSTLNLINNKTEVLVKGAFEEIIKRCNHIGINGQIKKLDHSHKEKLEKIAETESKEGLRVLALAYKPELSSGLANKSFAKQNTASLFKYTEDNLIFVGLVAMLDPPRETVKSSILAAKKAGIQVKIITGDHPLTAQAVGKIIGINIDKILTGDEIDKLNDAQLKKAIYETDIFARTSPQHKYRIVDILQKNNEVVAVTGDGVNDAPALKHADVGVAMGIKGTEATKEVADIILKDDNFTTIVTTIEEGRRVYRNVLTFIKYMLSANAADILTVSIITLAGFPLPILPLQILWVNIATDALPALALGQSPAGTNLMNEKPHPKKENLAKKFLSFILVSTIFQIAIGIILYFYGLNEDRLVGLDPTNLTLPSHARTMVFTQIVLFQLVLAFVCQDNNFKFKSIFSNKFLLWAVLISVILQLSTIYVPFLQTIFKTVPLSLREWVMLILASSTALLIPKVTKLIYTCTHALRHSHNFSKNL